MSIIKCNSFVEVYEKKATSRDIHELSGRPGRHDLTQYIACTILGHFKPERTGTLVDIGCGDGTLLRMASEKVSRAIGILPTQAELNRVEDYFKINKALGVELNQGFANATGLPPVIADFVVCNGVFILLAENEVIGSLHEIYRISKPGAKIFIGEIPDIDELKDKNYGDSVLAWLAWVLKKQGVASFIKRLKQTLRALFTNEPLLISPKKIYYAQPHDFSSLAAKHGLEIVSSFRHKELSPEGYEYESKTRWDYVFYKA